MDFRAGPGMPPGSYSISRNTMVRELVKLGLLAVGALILTIILSTLAARLVFSAFPEARDSDREVLFPLLTGFFILTGLVLCWQKMRKSCHFHLDIHPDRLQTRALWLRDHLDPLEVEEIKLAWQSIGSPVGGHVEIGGGGKTWQLCLGQDKMDCINDLLQACPNAVYFDAFGEEHPPKRPFHPEKVMLFRVRKARQAGIIYLVFGILEFMLVLSLGVWPIIHGGLGKEFLSHLLSIKFLLLAIAEIAIVLLGIDKIRESNRLANCETIHQPVPERLESEGR